MKINKSVRILQNQGLGNRRICEEIFWHHDIFRNGQKLDPSIDEIQMGDLLNIDGLEIEVSLFKYVLLNKPCGYETSHKPSRHASVFSLLPKHYVDRGVQAAGRLDVDTSGLLLFSDDGQFIHRLISGKVGQRQEVEKIYWVTGARPFSQEQVQHLLDGVELHDEPAPIQASQAYLTGPCQLTLGITTGKYHQVRRMVAAVGNHVEQLHRQRVGPYELPVDLPEGEFIEVDASLILG